MRRIVLPLTTADVCAIPAADVIDTITAADVRVAVEVVIHVYVDVTTTPAGAPSPATAPGSPHGPTDDERDRAGRNHCSG